MTKVYQIGTNVKDKTNTLKVVFLIGIVNRHIMMKENLENLILTGHQRKKRNKGRHKAICLISLCEWMAEWDVRGLAKGQSLLSATRDMRLWRAMINHILKGHCT